jgi:hypothetical protein
LDLNALIEVNLSKSFALLPVTSFVLPYALASALVNCVNATCRYGPPLVLVKDEAALWTQKLALLIPQINNFAACVTGVERELDISCLILSISNWAHFDH